MNTIRVGGASGFWGDAALSTPQLLAAGGLDYIVYDYLAEITMSILARARAEKPEAGYAADFVSRAMNPNLREIARQRVKIISNAGGLNPIGCARALRALVAELGLDLKVAAVSGDDLMARKLEFSARSEMFSGAAFPDAAQVLSINAYLGAFPIAQALAEGADIVITGRCVDSAVTLGACIHAFGWTREQLDRLAGGSLAGHILECGPQATGGNFTDWESVERIEEIGYPIAEIASDGSFVCTKPAGSGGLVTVGTVAEQMLYEIGDPRAYLLPDVVCDFAEVQIAQQGPDRVLVANAKGWPAPDTYKVCATYLDGYRGGLSASFYGIDASRKAERYADAVFKRARMALRARNLADFTEASVEIIGAESHYGSAKRIAVAREVVAKIAARHSEAAGVESLLREATGLGLSAPPGLSGFAGGRPKPMPLARLFSFTLPKAEVAIELELDGTTSAAPEPAGARFEASAQHDAPGVPAPFRGVAVPLVALAWARSGDKGDKANIGVIARKPDYFPYICRALTAERVAERFAHFLNGKVERFVLPGPCALNFLLHNVLGGGGAASLRNDPQGKGYGQLVLDMAVEMPEALIERDALPIV